MKLDSWTFDPMGVVFLVALILLMVGVIPFTPVGVGLVLLASQIKFPIVWAR